VTNTETECDHDDYTLALMSSVNDLWSTVTDPHKCQLT